MDDESANQRHIRRLLRSRGFTGVRTTADTEELFGKEGTPDADLVLLDLHMPGRDGFSVLRELNERRDPDRFVPVVVLTADRNPATRERALALGAADFLTRPFDHRELLLRLRNLLEQSDMHCAVVEANRQLSQRLQSGAAQRYRFDADLLVRLARAAEYRDDQTGTHTWRVGHLAKLIAQELGAEHRFADLIGLAARLHDVGKIGVPDRVLLKPGPLLDDEYVLMKAHTHIGASLLSGGDSPLMQMAETIALTHHEAWDGSGYPDGRAAEDIPLAGRVVAVADVFDALTHSRAYKTSWSESDALDELRLLRGTKLDPDAVDAFDRAYRNGATRALEVPRDDANDDIARAAIAASIQGDEPTH